MSDKQYIKIIEAENARLKEEIDKILADNEKKDATIAQLLGLGNDISVGDYLYSLKFETNAKNLLEREALKEFCKKKSYGLSRDDIKKFYDIDE